jgi:hypothetical protein
MKPERTRENQKEHLTRTGEPRGGARKAGPVRGPAGGGPQDERTSSAAARAAMPPAPPGEMPREEVTKIRAVSDAMARLGDKTDPIALAAEIKSRARIEISPEEVASIQQELNRGCESAAES